MLNNSVITKFLLFFLIGHNTQAQSRLTEIEFYGILDQLEALYSPDFAEKGTMLKITGDWTNNDYKADYNFTKENTYTVSISGGLAQHRLSNADTMALIICHEIGHYLGGYPKRHISISKDFLATIEGQADYFATAKCLKKYFREDDNKNIVKQMLLPAIVQESCDKSFQDPEAAFICKRSSMASLAAVKIMVALKPSLFPNLEMSPINFETPSLEIAFIPLHPTGQCRLDTFFQGALCNKPETVNFSDTDFRQGACTRGEGFSGNNGARPLCWFAL